MDISFSGADMALFIVVVARIAGIVVAGPILGERSVPAQARIGVACLIGLMAFAPIRASGLDISIGSPVGLALLLVKESLVGLTVGFMARLMLHALQMATYLVDFQMGFGMAGVFDPAIGAQASALGSIVNWLALMVFLGIDGHHRLIETIVKSYDHLPIGWSIDAEALLWGALKQFAYTVQVAIGLFGPVLIVMGVMELLLGVVSKAAPQMNILMVSLPLKIGVGLITITLWIATLDGPLAKALGRQLSWLPSLVRLMGHQ